MGSTVIKVTLMDKRIFVDIGSSTVKLHKQTNGSLSLILARSIPFKTDFDPIKGISESTKSQLYGLIKEIQDKNPKYDIKLYATAIFRKFDEQTREKFIDEFFIRTGLYFNIISPELESFYLQVALVGKYEGDEPLLLINIGGGSTELVVMNGKEAVETKNVDLGVGTILSEFEKINQPQAGIFLDKIRDFACSKLPKLNNKVKMAIYSGGELNYMQLAGYKLVPNKTFKDLDHPSTISLSNFSARNQEVFEKLTLKELEKLMPKNPLWMHGARACSALAQAICEKYDVETIIPSNSNLINGVARQEFRYVTISGSFRKHFDYFLKVRNQLVKQGIKILSPRFIEPKNPGEEFVIFSGDEGISPLELERHHLHSIKQCDALIVCNPAGYVGASTLIEIGYANAFGKRIIFTNKPEEFMLMTLPSQINL